MTINKKKKSISPTAVIIAVFLIAYTLIMFFFLYLGFITSLKTETDFVSHSNHFGIPRDFYEKTLAPWNWEWGNFLKVTKYFDQYDLERNGLIISYMPFGTMVWYTILYAGVGAFIATLCPCIVAYATSKFNYKFNVVLDTICIVTMIIPVVGSSMSMVSVLYQLNIYDTFIALFLQKFYFANMYYLMFSAIFKGVSKEYYEAAHIDGASELTVMIKIAFPLVATSFGLIFLLYFISFWNDYTTLMLYAPSHPTIAYALYRVVFLSTKELNNETVKMAGCVIIVVPVIILFIIFRNKIMGNLTIGGVKE